MGSLEERIVAKAIEHVEMGITEDMGNNRDAGGFIEECWTHVRDDRWAVDGIEHEPAEYGADYRYEWCAAYVSRLFAECDAPLEHKHGSGFYGCHRIIEWLDSLGEWTPAVIPSEDDQIIYHPGDIILFAWNKHIQQVERSGEDLTVKEAMKHVRHVGIVEKWEEGSDIVHTIEGNVGGVKRCKRKISDGFLLGAGFPFDDE